MKNSKLFIALVLFLSISPFCVYSQTEFMINGGFEDYDNVTNSNIPYIGAIDKAIGWHHITNTPDAKHLGFFPGLSGTARSGQGCGRFGIAIDAGLEEFFYGTTQQLTAGQTYSVSFWIRKILPNIENVPIGLVISDAVPSITLNPFSISQQPLITITQMNTEYVRASGCFTAQVSGTHYVTIGPFNEMGVLSNLLYTIDDVSVTSFPNDAGIPSAQLNINQPSFCVGDNVIIDGTASSNETSYIFEINNLTNNNQEYYSGIINGQAGTFNVSDLLTNPIPGNCYRATLTAIGGCSDMTSVDLCYDNPDVDFLNVPAAVCEGIPTNISVTGDDNWTYNWSNGDGGVGVKTTSVSPVFPSSQYSVTVTSPNGCSQVNTITLNVHSNNNLAPWMNGIQNLSNGTMGTDIYTVYIHQREILSFTSQLFNDNSNELIATNLISTNIPNSFTQTILPSYGNNQTLSFYWNTGQGFVPIVSPGIYEFTLTSNDGNQCNLGQESFTFRIIVICDQCPTCVSFENRTPSNSPLPPETKVGVCIEAGISQPVQTGNANVLFQAGASITLGEFFQAGPGFQAIIEPTTCVADCEDCCDDWAGFTFDAIPDPPYMNFNDNNPDNDIFQITDINHPFCAFGAQGFEFYILNANGVIMYSLTSNSNSCCSFESPAPENPIPHSSIWWDGYVTNIFGNSVRPLDGMYFYRLNFSGCDGQQSPLYQGYISIGGFDPYGMATNNNNSAIQIEESESVNGIIELQQKINIVPNPTCDFIEIIGNNQNQIQFVKILDDKGLEVLKESQFKNNRLNVSSLSPGTYFVSFMLQEYKVVKKFIKL